MKIDVVVRGITFNRAFLKANSLSECKEVLKSIDTDIVKEAYYLVNPKKRKLSKK
ncbi:MAG: hypothetical protein Unbinned2903contig1001_23 [Prokaryotic dsDNA virus sp.]|nr:MAG: hypothetical protein Unbinned2903contig1001_23 [Prokaryotic dsDNA virus sp.]|tara:strand:+ start:12476 stop:12640 length:165 start_codon:yes stop_codon:yes gene_type:complete